MWERLDGVDRAGGHGTQEDLAGRAGDMAWVMDGASAVSAEQVTAAKSDALWMVQHLDAELAEMAQRPIGLGEVVARAISRTAAVAAREWRCWPPVPPSAALGVIRRRGRDTEFLVLADVSVVLRTDVGVFHFTDMRVDRGNRQAKDAMAKMLADGRTYAQAYDEARPHLAEYRLSHMNREDGYWVASTDKAAVEHALVGSLGGVTEAVLATDGFMRAYDTFGLVTLDDLFEPGRSFEAIADEVRACEKADQETRHYPRWRVSDDLCAVRLRWAG